MRIFLLIVLGASVGVLAGVHLDRLLEPAGRVESHGSPRAPDHAQAVLLRWQLLENRPSNPEVPCPKDAVVIFIAGQSNAANSVGHRSVARHGVFTLYAGKCYRAAGPIAGAEGRFGSVWPLVGDLLIEAGFARSVILVSAAMGGTSITKWADPRGLASTMLLGTKAKPTGA
jgi:hypothetical protein